MLVLDKFSIQQFKTLITNRIDKIYCQWNCVLTVYNPFDIPARLPMILQFFESELWWNKLCFLSDPMTSWEKSFVPPNLIDDKAKNELKKFMG